MGLEWAGLLTVSHWATMRAVPVAAVITAVRIARVGCTVVLLIAELSILRRGLTMNDWQRIRQSILEGFVAFSFSTRREAACLKRLEETKRLIVLSRIVLILFHTFINDLRRIEAKAVSP